MCGIFAYSGFRSASAIVLNGLKSLEYRGYDSAGVAIANNSSLSIYKSVGRVVNLEALLKDNNVDGHVGIGHTRWATHGVVNAINAHPHVSRADEFAIVHNGVIENYKDLKIELINEGYEFTTETDTEVLVNLIDYIRLTTNATLEIAFKQALSKIVGSYAVVLISKNDNLLIASRFNSPLVIGVGDGEYFISSDTLAIIDYTKDVIFIKDQEIALISGNHTLSIKGLNHEILDFSISKLDIVPHSAIKGDYKHFMLKEIFEQPKALYNCFNGKIGINDIYLDEISNYTDKLIGARRIIIIGCGTSWHAGLIAKYFIEEFCRIPVDVEYASEFRYRKPIVYSDDVVIAISQSGETADTLAAVKLAREMGAMVLGICNVTQSSIVRMSHTSLYTNAGLEVGVASTKAFTTQLMTIFIMGLWLAKRKGTINNVVLADLLADLRQVPKLVENTLKVSSQVAEIAKELFESNNMLYLGRGYNFPIALEGALKLKELSYIHAEGYPAAEMKHGPIALIDEYMPVIFIANKDSLYDKVISNMATVKSRNGKIIAIMTDNCNQLDLDLVDKVILVPSIHEAFMPIINVIPLQLLSYFIAVARGCDVDKPRNLAKSVTVE